MKKILSIMLAAALALPIMAGERLTPEERAKVDYSSWLPQQGDWQIGFNLNPVATFVGNIFNGTINQTFAPLAGEPLLRMPGMVSIMGSYMLTDNLALRANIGVDVNGQNSRRYVQDDAANFLNPYSTLEGKDAWKTLNVGGSFSIGVEYRVGKRRVQGVFGGGLVYGIWGLNQNKFTYYNAITVDNQNPTNAGLAAAAGLIVDPKFIDPALGGTGEYTFISNPRLLDKHTGAGSHIAGIYGSVGVECFVAPKIALGLNVNLLLDYAWRPSVVSVWEGWNKFTNERQEIIIHDDAMQDGFRFSTDNIGANLYIAFYFGK